ncbi:hypothetical protein RFI_33864, partial [Reticulomyxa filosa]
GLKNFFSDVRFVEIEKKGTPTHSENENEKDKKPSVQNVMNVCNVDETKAREMMQSFESLFAVLDSESVLAEKDVLGSFVITFETMEPAKQVLLFNGLFILDKPISVEIIAADNDNDNNNDVEIIRDAHVAQNNNEKKKSQHDFLFHDDADNSNNNNNNIITITMIGWLIASAPHQTNTRIYIMYKYLLLLSFCMYIATPSATIQAESGIGVLRQGQSKQPKKKKNKHTNSNDSDNETLARLVESMNKLTSAVNSFNESANQLSQSVMQWSMHTSQMQHPAMRMPNPLILFYVTPVTFFKKKGSIGTFYDFEIKKI